MGHSQTQIFILTKTKKMKKLFSALVILSMTFAFGSLTGNTYFAGVLTVSVAAFSAIMHVSGLVTGSAFTAPIVPDFTQKSFEEQDSMTAQELAEYKAKEVEWKIQKSALEVYNSMQEEKSSENPNDEKIEKMEATIKSLTKELDVMAVRLKAAAEKGGNFTEEADILKELSDNMDTVKKLAQGAEGEISFKADTLRSSISNNTQAQDDPGIGQLATRKLTMYDLFRKIPMGENNNGTIRYWDWDSATTVRAAEMRAEGAAFPESTAKWQEYTLTLKKIGDTLPVSAEFYEDEAMFAAELNIFLMTNVALILDYQIARGSGTGNNMSGLQTNATAFAPASVTHVADPTIYDLIEVADEQITKTGGSKYSPDTVLMNKSTINKMKLSKDANENYILPPFVSRDGREVGMKIVIEANVFEDDVILVGDRRYGKIYEKGGFTMSRGTVDAQFAEDMETLKIRKRAAFLLRNADQGGWVVISDVDAALAAIDATS